MSISEHQHPDPRHRPPPPAWFPNTIFVVGEPSESQRLVDALHREFAGLGHTSLLWPVQCALDVFFHYGTPFDLLQIADPSPYFKPEYVKDFVAWARTVMRPDILGCVARDPLRDRLQYWNWNIITELDTRDDLAQLLPLFRPSDTIVIILDPNTHDVPTTKAFTVSEVRAIQYTEVPTLSLLLTDLERLQQLQAFESTPL